MKHTIQVNNKNQAEHIIHLDQHLPINIKPLPRHIAYQIQDTPLITTTTSTLQKETIKSILQKIKHITIPTHLIIIQNGHNENLKLQTRNTDKTTKSTTRQRKDYPTGGNQQDRESRQTPQQNNHPRNNKTCCKHQTRRYVNMENKKRQIIQ